jgi:hypothetical protein
MAWDEAVEFVGESRSFRVRVCGRRLGRRQVTSQ